MRMLLSLSSVRAMAIRCFCPPEECHAAFAHDRLPALIRLGDEAGCAGDIRRVLNAFRLLFRRGDAHVLPDGLGVQERLLQNQADVCAQIFAVNLLNIHAANGDFAARGRIQPLQQVHHGGFAAAVPPSTAAVLPRGW